MMTNSLAISQPPSLATLSLPNYDKLSKAAGMKVISFIATQTSKSLKLIWLSNLQTAETNTEPP